jgi:hypothetical protein
MSDPFAGAWRVKEYVFDASGAPLGVVHQTRRVAPSEKGLRIHMDCDPDAGVVMENFRGHHEFDVVVDGRLRRYQGPAVLGMGVAVDRGIVLGRGVWPHFGYSFTSYSVLVAKDRQLTGGAFHRGGEVVARIAGVAAPAAQAVLPASLGGPTWPGEVAPEWVGTMRVVGPDSELRTETTVVRRYDGDAMESEGEAFSVIRDARSLRIDGRIEGERFVGFGKSYGWLTMMEAVCGDAVLEWRLLVDGPHRRLVEIRRWLLADRLERIDVISLKPADGEER